MSGEEAQPNVTGSNESSRVSKNGDDKVPTQPINIQTHATTSRTDQHHLNQSDLTPSQISEIPINDLINTANVMSNLMMAHKIALEDDFKLEPGMDIAGPLMSLSPILGSTPPKSSASSPKLHNKVREIVHEAFWESLRKEFDTQSDAELEKKVYEISKQLLQDVKQKIIELLLPQHTRLKEEINDKLDAQVINQLCGIGCLDMMDYSKYFLELLGKLCAPIRDDALAELNQSTDLVKRYKGMMELIELMRLDLANFTLNKFKPHIKAHSVEYERSKFSELLKQQQSIGIDGLEYTKLWLNRSVENFDSQFDLKESVNKIEKKLTEDEELTFNEANANEAPDYSRLIDRILNSAFCNLLEWNPEEQKLYPETLLFDQSTFNIISNQFKHLMLAASILLTTFAFARQFNIQDDNNFRTTLKSHVVTLLSCSYEHEEKETTDNVKLETIAVKLFEEMKQDARAHNLDMQKELFMNQIIDLQNQSNRIRELVRRRILQFVDTLLNMDTNYLARGLSTKTPPPVTIPLGLSILENEISIIMAHFVKIVRYNRRVHYKQYQKIIEDYINIITR